METETGFVLAEVEVRGSIQCRSPNRGRRQCASPCSTRPNIGTNEL